MGNFKKGNHISRTLYSRAQELFYKLFSKITNNLVKQLLSMTVFSVSRTCMACPPFDTKSLGDFLCPSTMGIPHKNSNFSVKNSHSHIKSK